MSISVRPLARMPLTVLILWPSSTIWEILQRSLPHDRYRLLFAKSGDQAMRLLEENRVHVVLLNLESTEKRADLLQYIQMRRKAWHGFPYVIAVGNEDASDQQAGELGINEIFSECVTAGNVEERLINFFHVFSQFSDNGYELARSKELTAQTGQ